MLIYQHGWEPTINILVLCNTNATPKSNETINVSFENDEGCELSLTSVGGKLCYKQNVPAGQNQCHIDTNLSSGTYIVGVKGKSGSVETRKIIVR